MVGFVLVEIDQYRQVFVNEIKILTAKLRSLVVELEKNLSDLNLAEEVMRIVHSIKGMAAVMEYSSLATLSHELETILVANIETGEISEVIISSFLIFIDKLEQFIRLLEVGDEISSVDLEDLLEKAIELDKLRQTIAKKLVIKVKFSSEVKMKSVRAFLVLQNLEDIAKILSSSPSKEQLELDTIFNELSILIQTKKNREKIIHIIQAVSGVSDVLVQEFRDDLFQEPKSSYEGLTIPISLEELNKIENIIEDTLIYYLNSTSNLGSEKKETTKAVMHLYAKISKIQDIISSFIFVSLDNILSPFTSIVRDLAITEGKKVELRILGDSINIKYSIIESLYEILLHLIRNAVSHGIENPFERQSLNKRDVGIITIQTNQDGNLLCIEVEDDGAGLDLDLIQQKAIDSGLISKDDPLKSSDLTEFIFQTGFSTRKSSTEVSGRGYGLNIVKNSLKSLNGKITVSSQKNSGTKFIITIPLHLNSQELVIVESGQQLFGIPAKKIQGILDFKSVKFDIDSNLITIKDLNEKIPIIELYKILFPKHLQEYKQISLENKQILLWENRKERLAIIVNKIHGSSIQIVSDVPETFKIKNAFSGVALTPTGQIVLVIDSKVFIQPKNL